MQHRQTAIPVVTDEEIEAWDQEMKERHARLDNALDRLQDVHRRQDQLSGAAPAGPPPSSSA